MSKRFIDTTIWEKPWFQELTPTEKCAFIYLFTKCDNVGVWQPNFKLADFLIGETVDWNELLKLSCGNIKTLNNDKWYIPDFCEFQYGTLRETCKPHQSYIALLKKHGLFKGYTKGINGVQEKEKEKDKELDKEKDKDIERVIHCLNDKTESKYQNRGATRDKIIARFNDGYTPDDLFRAIIAMSRKWMHDEKMRQYLRPITLFAPSKIDGYIAEYQRETDGNGKKRD